MPQGVSIHLLSFGENGFRVPKWRWLRALETGVSYPTEVKLDEAEESVGALRSLFAAMWSSPGCSFQMMNVGGRADVRRSAQ